MNIEDVFFHDSQILEVREISLDQTLEYVLDYPVDWENNVFEKRILRFKDVIYYLIDEIPFQGWITILKIEGLGQITRNFGNEYNQFETVRNKIILQTNAGKRIIEFSDFELVPFK